MIHPAPLSMFLLAGVSRAVSVVIIAALLSLCVPAISSSAEPHASAKENADQTAVQELLSAASTAHEEGRYQDAVSMYSHAAKLSPEDSRIYLGRGMAYELLNAEAKAKADYLATLALDPINYRAMENLARIYEREDKHIREAARLYKKALVLDPRPEWQENLAVWVKMLETRLRSQDSYAAGCWQLGNEKVERGDLHGAEVAFTKAIDKNPVMYQAYHSRGLVRLKIRDLAGALQDFDETVRLAPSLPDGFLHRALALEMLGERDEARKDLERAVELAPRDPSSLYHLAQILEAENETERATELYREALRHKASPELRTLIRERLTALAGVARKSRRNEPARKDQPGPLW